MNAVIDFIVSILRTSTPILYVALGVLVMQLSGVMNVGADGMMLLGCFSGVVGSYLFGNVWLGGLFAMVITGLFGLLFGLFTITLKTNQVVVGVAFNILSIGMTTTLYRLIYGVNASPTKIESFPPLFRGLSLPVFLGIGLVFVLTWFLNRTKPGLKIRAVGENPLAVDTVGLSVTKIRYLSTVLGAMIIGFGGAFLSTGLLTFFTEEMTASRGFIALAAVVFGRYKPAGILLAVWVFGAGDALQYKLQATSSPIPTQFIQMIPYLLTIIALVFFVRKSRGPAALGEAYHKN